MKIFATVKEQVYQSIKQDICNGKLAPGQWLQEQEIASQLNVSRSPVREAFRMLSGDGLVNEIPNKGVFVRKFTQKDIEDIFDVRKMLETYAIYNSKKYMTKDKEEELYDSLEKMKVAFRTKDMDAYVDLDTHIHELIIRLSGNELVNLFYDKVHSMLQPFRIYSLTETERFSESITEHTDIVEAIIKGDVATANERNLTHLTLAQGAVKNYLRGMTRDVE